MPLHLRQSNFKHNFLGFEWGKYIVKVDKGFCRSGGEGADSMNQYA
jgi:hypothetical protein